MLAERMGETKGKWENIGRMGEECKGPLFATIASSLSVERGPERKISAAPLCPALGPAARMNVPHKHCSPMNWC